MFRRWWFSLVLAGTTLFSVSAVRSSGQEEIRVPPSTRNNVKDMRDGRKPLHQTEIDDAAKLSVLRLTDEVNRGLKSGKTPVPMHEIVQQAAEFVLTAPYPPKKFDEKQIAYTEAAGKAFMPPLRSLLVAEKDKPLKYDFLVRMNAARMLANVGKSGYQGVAALAIDILANPKEHDAVKLFAVQALKNLFAACSPENPEKSTFTDLELEKRAIQALIDFVQRPLSIPTESPENEIAAFHYVRREAIRALGNVRFPAVRKDKTIEMSPAVILLRFAVGAPALQPPPNVSERAEALIGYLQLNPDREQQMDFAGFYVGTAIRILIADFNSRKDLPVIPKDPSAKIEDIPTPKPADYHSWRMTGGRLMEVLKSWKTNWEVNSAQPPPNVAKIMNEMTDQSLNDLLPPLTASALQKSPIALGTFDTFLQNQRPNVTSTSLFRDDPNTQVWVVPAAPAPEKDKTPVNK